MTSEYTALDALKYAAALLRQRIEWTTDSIGGSACDGERETEIDAILDAIGEICVLAARFGDPLRYSDGRLVQSRAEIQRGLVTDHVWHPDPTQEESQSWRGSLPSDPGVRSPGTYEVTTDPAAQKIHVQIVRMQIARI